MVRKKIFSEFVHLDMPLSLIELHYEQESAPFLPWTNEEFKIKPYIFYERKEGLVYIYYDLEGIEWQKEQAGLFVKSEKILTNIKLLYNKVKNILEKEEGLDRDDFFKFIEDLKVLWPWLNYMWWGIEYAEENSEDVGDLMEIRKYTEKFTPGVMQVFEKSLIKIYPAKKEYAKVILLNEVRDNKVPTEEILKKRQKHYLFTNNKLFYSTEILKEYNIIVDDVHTNLNGQTAFPGIAKGKVRIISKREDMMDFKRGEILVASTTTPDYMIIMGESSAIISEHGGLLCHASIASRELKIPCLVGVKNATKLLKTGDFIEVNATEGHIRKID